MFDSFGDDKALLRAEINRAILEIDQEPAIHHVEEFIQLAMGVPMVFTFHNPESHDRFVYLAERLVVPLVRASIDELLHVDNLQRLMQDVEVSVVGKPLRRPLLFHV